MHDIESGKLFFLESNSTLAIWFMCQILLTRNSIHSIDLYSSVQKSYPLLVYVNFSIIQNDPQKHSQPLNFVTLSCIPEKSLWGETFFQFCAFFLIFHVNIISGLQWVKVWFIKRDGKWQIYHWGRLPALS